MKAQLAKAMLFLLPAISMAQVPVDEDGNIFGKYESQAEVMPFGEDDIPRLSQSELQDLVGPIALYPDDLLAIVLPAAAYPLQVVEAARFLKALETDPTLQPDPDWDDSIIALINYPEVVELLNEDLDWTWRLGESVVAQQTDVIAAVESFRDRAYAAGNLRSDEYQTVANDEGIISISPTADDVIYVPYYEPAQVVYYQPRPAYYYHPQPYPVYYYPYAANHHFDRGPFWGVTTAFSIGWYTDSLNVYHHSYRGHPYYGRTYWNDGWYRQPSINVYNTTYVNNNNVVVNRHSDGDNWRARDDRREYARREGYTRAENRSPHRSVAKVREYEPITFRERASRPVNSQSTRRENAIAQYRGERQASPERNRVAQQRSNIERRDTSKDTRRQDAIVRTRDAAQNTARETSRETTADRSRRTSTYRPEPARQTRVQTPARTTTRTPAPAPRESRQPAPAPRESRQTETRTRAQPSPPPESRSQQPRSSTSKSNNSARKSSERRRQNEDRQH
jgi:hypothetical protein